MASDAEYAELNALPDDAPEALICMKLVALGDIPDSAYGRAVVQWLREKPVAFAEKLTELQTRYWAGKKGAAGGTWDRSGPCPVCNRVCDPEDEGSGASAMVLERWLKEEG